MPETYTTEQVLLLTGHNRKEVYTLANRFGWSDGVAKPSYKTKLFDAGKVNKYLQAQAITKQAQQTRGYGKHGRLLWPVTTCPRCSKPAAFIRLATFCIDGHYIEE
jgi:hypothetical protein